MKRTVLGKKFITALLLGTAFLAGCGDDDDFTPVSRNRGYDYLLTSTKEFADYPCNDVREGREAVVGREKESYYCQFDYRDSVYIWAGYDDTLTATGKEFTRKEISSSSQGSSSSDNDDYSSSSRSSSSYSSSSYSSSSSVSSSSNSSSSSYRASTSSSWYDHNLSSSATRKKTYEYCDDYSVNWPDTKDDIFNPNIEYGTMTDPRDGKTYRTVEVLGQIWMAENLNFADSANFPLLKGNTFCYEDDEEKCNILGRLYKRQAAMNTESCYNDADSFCNTGDEPVQGICPDGWHLPSAEDVWELIDLEKGDARAFMSAYGWISGEEAVLPGENTYGLSFVGNYFKTLSKCGTMSGLGMYAIMWVSNYGLYHHYMVIQGQENHIILLEYETGSLERGVRCIKDE